jgi:hypothetical protein
MENQADDRQDEELEEAMKGLEPQDGLHGAFQKLTWI